MRVILAFLLGSMLVVLTIGLIHTNAAQAMQPQTVTPPNLLPAALAAKLAASDGVMDDNLGYSVAANGDTIVVGAFGDNNSKGSVYVFVKPSGGWRNTLTETAKLIASDGTAGDLFSFAVAIRDDTIVAGAVGDNSSQGAAYVFVKPNGGWSGTLTETAKVTAADGGGGDAFASALAINSDTLVAGAPTQTIGPNANQGSAYIFAKPTGGWVTTSTFTAKLTAADGMTEDAFGGSLALSGDTLVVGAPGFYDEPGLDAAYIFQKPGGGWVTTSTFTAKLTASDGVGTDVFGLSATISNDVVVLGAADDDNKKGSIYIFDKPNSGWSGTLTETAKITASDRAAGDRFGVSLSVISDTIVVGAPGADSGQGSAYLFVKPNNGWVTTSTFAAKLTASDGAADNFFGFSTAINSDTVVIGAQGYDGARGAVYVFSQPLFYFPIIFR
ncbi:MAG: FG-GAP repeat protein [Anaerolineae bacterium]|nr:FG-GAP repeat protein [Anaerolineae bacterium]